MNRRVVLAVAVAVVAIAAGLVVVLGRSGGSPAAATTVPAKLPGQLDGPAPWPRNGDQLAARLATLGLRADAFEGTALHFHQHLDVFVDGRRVTVPAGIGIDPAGAFISPLHTHDTSGVIHVESPTVRPFTLAEFFGVWGVPLRSGRLGGYAAGDGRALRAYVNGRRVEGDPGRIVLTPHQELVIAFGTQRELPHPIPASYPFPAGL
jgi:hypothetical protein